MSDRARPCPIGPVHVRSNVPKKQSAPTHLRVGAHGLRISNFRKRNPDGGPRRLECRDMWQPKRRNLLRKWKRRRLTRWARTQRDVVTPAAHSATRYAGAGKFGPHNLCRYRRRPNGCAQSYAAARVRGIPIVFRRRRKFRHPACGRCRCISCRYLRCWHHCLNEL